MSFSEWPISLWRTHIAKTRMQYVHCNQWLGQMDSRLTLHFQRQQWTCASSHRGWARRWIVEEDPWYRIESHTCTRGWTLLSSLSLSVLYQLLLTTTRRSHSTGTTQSKVARITKRAATIDAQVSQKINTRERLRARFVASEKEKRRKKRRKNRVI